jgi:hypothetical protein
MKVMIIVKATRASEAGQMPSQQLLTDMGNFNEELVKAGVMLAGDGLHPSKKGARVRFSGKDRMVIDGPFAETKETDRGLLALEGRLAAGGDRLGQALPQSARRRMRDRDPPGVRGRRFRRGPDARVARARGVRHGRRQAQCGSLILL